MSDSLTPVVGAKVCRRPLISVVIPNYNTAGYIAETLDSVFRQTFRDFEVIVINDASPDTEQLKKTLAAYFDRIVFIDKAVNSGTSATRNQAVGCARADVISFLDADDIWLPEYLQELYAFLIAEKFDMAYADGETFISGRADKHHDFLKFNPAQGEITRQMLIEGRCHILPTGTLIKKDSFLAVGGFDAGVARTEDFDLWMRLLFNGTRIGYLRKILFKFRLSPGSGSGDSIVRLQRNADVWRILQAKVNFSDDENRIVERHIADAEAAVVRAKGRLYINQRNWPAAIDAFREASRRASELDLPVRHKLKMKTVLFLLQASPELARRVFRTVRSDELDFMPADSDS